MKIRVNYDLIDKIKESKTGFSLKRTSSKHFLVVGFAMLLNLPSILLSDNKMSSLITTLIVLNLIGFTHRCLENKILKELYKDNSISDLKLLAKILRKHYINTDYELLQDAYEYETNYSFILDNDKIPRIKEEKYIMVPVVDRDGEKEVSLVQEHLIGSRNYELYYGSPSKSKVLKPIFNTI